MEANLQFIIIVIVIIMIFFFFFLYIMKNKSNCLSIFCFLKTLLSFPNEFLGVASIYNTFSDVVHKGNTFLIFTISKILFKTLFENFYQTNPNYFSRISML